MPERQSLSTQPINMSDVPSDREPSGAASDELPSEETAESVCSSDIPSDVEGGSCCCCYCKTKSQSGSPILKLFLFYYFLKCIQTGPIEEDGFTLPGACCKKNCVVKFSSGTPCLLLESFRSLRQTLAHDEVTKLVFALLVQQPKKSWMFTGMHVCRLAWRRLVGIGSYRLARLHQHAKQGFLDPPNDLRLTADHGGAIDSDVALHVDSFFQEEWQFAEPLPTVSRSECADKLDSLLPHLATLNSEGKIKPGVVNLSSVSEWLYGSPGFTLQATQSGTEIRWVGPRTLTEWFLICLFVLSFFPI